MKLLLIMSLIITGSFSVQLKAQDFKYIDSVYVQNIRSVKFNPAGNPLLMPLIPISGGLGLELSFDDLDNVAKDYNYTLIHCNADWTPTQNLSELEYLNGYTHDVINTGQLSFNTLIPYLHYDLIIPNDNISWKLSGNYLLKVTGPDNEKVVITRRFVVYESLVDIIPRNVRTAKVEKDRTHQEFDFEVNFKETFIRNPRVELSATAICNGRWDNAIYGLTPVFSRTKSVDFDYQDKIIFPAGKEFRFFDMRNVSYGGENIVDIKRVPDGYEAQLRPEKINTDIAYLFRTDINGSFVIDCRDLDECDLRGDYVYVFFTLLSETEIEDNDVYITGAFNDWELKPEHKMVYNIAKGRYEAEILLKQGYYNYQFSLFNPKTKVRDDYELQGNWHETENKFSIILYYRPFGERYDRVISVNILDSRKY